MLYIYLLKFLSWYCLQRRGNNQIINKSCSLNQNISSSLPSPSTIMEQSGTQSRCTQRVSSKSPSSSSLDTAKWDRYMITVPIQCTKMNFLTFLTKNWLAVPRKSSFRRGKKSWRITTTLWRRPSIFKSWKICTTLSSHIAKLRKLLPRPARSTTKLQNYKQN